MVYGRLAGLPTEDLKTHVQDIISLLGENADDKVSADTVENELEKFLEYGVPLDQAKQTLLKKFGGGSVAAAASERTVLSSLKPDQRQVKVIAQVLSVNPKEITVRGENRQIFYGLLGDESGTVPFTAWEEIDAEKGDILQISNAYTREWQGAVQLNISQRSRIEKKDKNALPKDTFEPKKQKISDLHAGIGTVELNAVILEVSDRKVTIDDKEKTVFSGVLGDETGKAQFTAWYDYKLKKGDTVHINGASVKSWRGIAQVNFDEDATVKKLKKDAIAVESVPVPLVPLYEIVERDGAYDIKIEGRVIDIQSGSGFILRCPECNRMIQDGSCQIHGEVEGIPDLRVKCVVDDGNGSVNAVFDRKASESILGKTLQDCKEMKTNQLQGLIIESLFAQKMQLRGNALNDNFGTTFITSEVKIIEMNVEEEAKKLAAELEEW